MTPSRTLTAWAIAATFSSACVAGVGGRADAGRDAGSDSTPSVDQAVGSPEISGDKSTTPPPITDAGTVTERGKPDPNLIDCPSRAQYILILDFRSGWWAGAGGGGGEGMAGVIFALMADQCQGTRIEFHHILKDIELTCDYPAKKCAGHPLLGVQPDAIFHESDWNNYTQIWILSGSEKDASDLLVASELFKKVADASKATCLPFFVGLGSGFIDHGNRAAEAFGLGTIAMTALADPNFWIYGPDMRGTQLAPHVLFTGVDSLADVIERTVGDGKIAGDSLVSNPLVEVIARDNTGAASIGVGRLPATLDLRWGRPFVIDAGAQRFYLVDKSAHKGTLQYLRNLTNYLGSVGCKSDEEPIVP
jgi:hypothetical protein